MARQQTTAADAEFRIAFRASDALDQFHPRPDAAGILPAAARAAQPFAQNRAPGHQAALVLLERSRERAHLAGGAHADAMMEASRLVETARREPLGIPRTWVTISRP
jgi:hypothetical protein